MPEHPFPAQRAQQIGGITPAGGENETAIAAEAPVIGVFPFASTARLHSTIMPCRHPVSSERSG